VCERSPHSSTPRYTLEPAFVCILASASSLVMSWPETWKSLWLDCISGTASCTNSSSMASTILHVSRYLSLGSVSILATQRRTLRLWAGAGASYGSGSIVQSASVESLASSGLARVGGTKKVPSIIY